MDEIMARMVAEEAARLKIEHPAIGYTEAIEMAKEELKCLDKEKDGSSS